MWDTDEDSLQLNTMMSGGGDLDSPPNLNTTDTTYTIEAVTGGSSGMTDTDVDSGARSRFNPRGYSDKRAPAIPAVRVNRD